MNSIASSRILPDRSCNRRPGALATSPTFYLPQGRARVILCGDEHAVPGSHDEQRRSLS
jgi:hypothetical protein